jgi:hypothetical protein
LVVIQEMLVEQMSLIWVDLLVNQVLQVLMVQVVDLAAKKEMLKVIVVVAVVQVLAPGPKDRY